MREGKNERRRITTTSTVRTKNLLKYLYAQQHPQRTIKANFITQSVEHENGIETTAEPKQHPQTALQHRNHQTLLLCCTLL